MPGCATRCTTYRQDTTDNAWEDVRAHFGPVTEVGSDVYVEDFSEWATWSSEHGVSVSDANMFGKWLIWKCSYGTTEYGNLPTRKREHTGISCIPCPYDNRSSENHTRLWLELEDSEPIPSRNNHGTYYMRVAQRGASWGFECTYDTCNYFVSNGTRYFHG